MISSMMAKISRISKILDVYVCENDAYFVQFFVKDVHDFQDNIQDYDINHITDEHDVHDVYFDVHVDVHDVQGDVHLDGYYG